MPVLGELWEEGIHLNWPAYVLQVFEEDFPTSVLSQWHMGCGVR